MIRSWRSPWPLLLCPLLLCPLLLCLLLLGVFGASLAWSQETEPDRVGPFMRAKLEHAKKVVEGLTLEDFELLAKHAQELSLISQATNWQVLQTPEYRHHSTEFRRTADALRDAAMKKNLDGATLAYVEMTMKCVHCHKYVRNVRAASVPHIPRLPQLDDTPLRALTR